MPKRLNSDQTLISRRQSTYLPLTWSFKSLVFWFICFFLKLNWFSKQTLYSYWFPLRIKVPLVLLIFTEFPDILPKNSMIFSHLHHSNTRLLILSACSNVVLGKEDWWTKRSLMKSEDLVWTLKSHPDRHQLKILLRGGLWGLGALWGFFSPLTGFLGAGSKWLEN